MEKFLKKNLKIITLVILGLFFIKSFQSCNRSMSITKLEKELIYVNDSLTTMYGTTEDGLLIQLDSAYKTIDKLKYEVKLANAKADAADSRASAVQSTAEKVRKNTTTTINIENRRNDTISVKKEIQ